MYMLMFNEDIKARDTTYDINFLTVSDFQEIYFDVYELVINGNKYIAEKVSEYQGMPVVTIPVTINGLAEDASFVLKKGAQEVLFNKNNSLTHSNIPSTDTDFLDSLNEDSISEISNLYIDSKAINEELEKAKLSAAEYAKAIKEQKIEEATQAIERKKKDAKKEIESYKKDLLSEFYGLTEDIRSSLHESNTAEQLVIRKNVSETLEILSEELDTRIEKASAGVKKFYDNKIKLIEESVLDITKNQRDNVIAIINESKQSLLDQINTITVPQSSVIVERDGRSTLDLKELKKEIENKITAKFSAEMGSLKRYIELSSGGGSVAQQFAAGGTMNGSLTVTGTISASQYLGIVTSTGNEVLIGGNSAGTNMLIGTNDNFNLNIETAGTTKMTVTSAGNVGIGTPTPVTRLHVNGEYNNNGIYLSRGATTIGYLGSYSSYIASGTNDSLILSTYGSNCLINPSTGNVGIGTTAPAAKLQVGPGDSGNLVVIPGAGGSDGSFALRWGSDERIGFTSNAVQYGFSGISGGALRLGGGTNFGYIVGNSINGNILLNPTSGNIGIGTTAPGAKLHVLGANSLTSIVEAPLHPALHLYSNGVSIGNIGSGNITGAGSVDLGIQTPSGSKLFLAAGSTTPALTISAGVVSIDSITINRGVGTNTTSIAIGGGLTSNTTGSSNTAVGIDALLSNTTGANNSAFGLYALWKNTTGSNNIAVGYGALLYNTTGNNNTAVGYSTLLSNTDGTYNSALGTYALRSNTTGPWNTAVGFSALYSNTTGRSNSAVGYNVLYSNTTGESNSAFGNSALYSNTTGNNNLAFGDSALRSNTTGNSNSAIGTSALYSNTAGYHNLAVGFNALYANTSGYSNVAAGSQALYTNTTGINNSAVGRQSLYLNTTGSYNSAIGTSALSTNTTGSSNTAVGFEALKANTTGNNNSAIGYQSLLSNTTGIHNLAVGYTALYLNTTGSYNLAIGYQSLYSNTTANSNSAVGYQALYSNTSGNNNSAFGYNALIYNTTGNSNTALGVSALYSNTTGYSNVAIGVNALLSNTTGNINTAIGYNVLNQNTTGIHNSALGNMALAANTTGAYNSAFGSYALYRNTTGVQNSAFGPEALGANTTGNNNSAFGAYVLYASTTGANNSSFGHSTLYSNTTGSNNVAVGNSALLFNTTGVDNSAVGFNALRLNTTGNYNLAVGSNALYSNTTGVNNSAVGFQALYSNTTGGSNAVVGLYALWSNTSGSNNIAIGLQAGRYITGGSIANDVSNNSVFIGSNTKAAASGQTNQIVIGDSAQGIGNHSVVLGNDSIEITALKGKVGIGTSTPTANFQVNQSVNGTGTISVAAGGTTVNGASTQFLNTFKVGDTITSAGQTLTITAISSNTLMTTSAAGVAITSQPYTLTGGTRFSVLGNGNVGIGTTTPAYKLSVSDTSDGLAFISLGKFSSQFYHNNYSLTYDAGGLDAASNARILLTTTSSNTSPSVDFTNSNSQGRIYLSTNALGSGNLNFIVAGYTTLMLRKGDNRQGNAILSSLAGDTTYNNASLLVRNRWDGAPAAVIAKLATSTTADIFQVTNESLSPYFNVTATGNVGVGALTPASKVTVTGGDIELTDASAGVIFKTPDGTKRYRMTIDNAGAPVFTLLP